MLVVFGEVEECGGLENAAYLSFLVHLAGKEQCFEDLERSFEDILSLCFHTLYLWTIAHLSPVSIIYDDFLARFSLSS